MSVCSCLTLCDPMNCSLSSSSVHESDSPGKNTGVGCYFLLQEIFPTQGSNWHHLHWQADSFTTKTSGKPCNGPQNTLWEILMYVAGESGWKGNSVPRVDPHRQVSVLCCAQSPSRVRLFATPSTVACQVPLSVGILSKNTGVGSLSFLQGNFLTQ